jgi:hypothetical protein
MKNNMFDPHKSFFDLNIVRWITVIILLISFAVAVIIIVNSNLNYDFSYVGFNKFVLFFQVPLGVFALLIPLLAVCAANHRSEQSKEGMKLANIQNNFSNFYKHLEEFQKYIDLKNDYKNEFPEIIDIDVKGRKLHTKLFPNPKRDGIQLSIEFQKKFYSSVFEIAERICIREPFAQSSIYKIIETLHDLFLLLSDQLGHSVKIIWTEPSFEIEVKIKRKSIRIPHSRLRNFVSKHLFIHKYIYELICFDEEFDADNICGNLLDKMIILSRKIPNIGIESNEEGIKIEGATLSHQTDDQFTRERALLNQLIASLG